MSAELVIGVLQALRLGTAILTANQNGDRQSALEVLTTGNLAAMGLTGEALATAQLARAAMTYLSSRKIYQAEALALLELAEAEGRDVTSEEVQAALDGTQRELDETQADINALGDNG